MLSTKILVVEDDKFLLQAYKVKLEKEGFDVKSATNGAEMFEVLKTFKPSVILLDLVMPQMDGFEALKKLKQEEKSDIPVIVASNLGQAEDIEKSKKLGAADYIVKSDLSMEDLVNKVKELKGK
jgi:DNA-binding response OmpR family regulator